MAKEKIQFPVFLESIPNEYLPFVSQLHDFLETNNCTYDIKDSKSGYVLSYVHKPTKKTIANYVFRKKGPMIRIYADNINKYMPILNELPEDMKKHIIDASVCKRLINPDDCNSRCTKGFDFILDDKTYQKCRYNCFFFYLSEENNPYLKKIVESEVSFR